MVELNQLKLKPFVPLAYYDKHMDCIRVMTHDRSVTEHRIDGFFTVHECNHRARTDPQYVGFTIKGIYHMFKAIGLEMEGVHKLTDLINRIVQYKPGSAMAETLRIIFANNPDAKKLKVRLDPGTGS